MQKDNITVDFMLCPLRVDTWRLKGMACGGGGPEQRINTWQIAEVSGSAGRHADGSGGHVDL